MSGPISSALYPCRILSAEDVDLNRQILRAGLTRLGHQVEFAVNGAEALQMLQTAHFDLVLMDVHMPVMDGVEATRLIRELAPPLCNIPVLALTANVLVSEQREYISAGMDECLAKPVDWDRLRDAIARHAGRASILDLPQLESLLALMGGDELEKLLSRALATLESLAQGDASRLQEDAHKARGMAGTLGLAATHRTVAGIQAAAAGGRRELAAMTRLQREIAATREALAAAGFKA